MIFQKISPTTQWKVIGKYEGGGEGVLHYDPRTFIRVAFAWHFEFILQQHKPHKYNILSASPKRLKSCFYLWNLDGDKHITSPKSNTSE